MTPGVDNHTRLLTPAGTGAIGLIRIAGPEAVRILARIFRPAGHPSPEVTGEQLDSLFDGNRLRYGHLVDADEVIDDVIIARVNARDLTTFDISAHGGVRVVERILELFEREGASLQDESGASETIWPHRTMIEREALEALSAAKTARCAGFLAWQRKHLAARIEESASRSGGDSARAEQEFRGMMGRYRAARYLMGGATLAIVGPPNSGKSTLFNRLMGRSAAIVSPQAGTTRDWVVGEIELDGVPITLADTAGRRDAEDSLEKEAIARGTSIGRRADVRVLLLDGSSPLPRDLRAMSAPLAAGAPCIPVVNKADLQAVWRIDELADRLGGSPPEPVAISAQNGDGVAELELRILGALGFENWIDDAPAIFTARQYDLAGQVLSGCRASESAVFARNVGLLIGMFSDADG